MRTFALLSVLSLVLFQLGCSTIQPETAPLSIVPEVQTAEWAVKWWMPRHEEKLATVANSDAEILLLGDSITHGWEKDKHYLVWKEYFGEWKTGNLGFSGDRTEQVIWRLQKGEVEGVSPKLVILMIGTNNTGHRQDPAKETVLGIEYIIKELRERLPDSKILLLAVFPRGETQEDELRVLNSEINTMLPLMADDKHVFFLDINDAFLDERGVLSKDIMPDLLHPNPAGYRMWAEAMLPKLRELMGE